MPLSLFAEYGCAAGYVLVVEICKLVLEGEVYNISSFGNLTKPSPPGPGITQLFTRTDLALVLVLIAEYLNAFLVELVHGRVDEQEFLEGQIFWVEVVWRGTWKSD